MSFFTRRQAHLERVAKYNHNHDPANGRFSSGPGGTGGMSPKKMAATYTNQTSHNASQSFSASDYHSGYADPNVSEDDILKQFDPDKINALQNAGDGKHMQDTNVLYGDGKGGYTPERESVQAQVLLGRVNNNGKDYGPLLSPEIVKGATPAAGEQPVYTMLGGRGGSGKSGLEGRVYDKSKAVYVNPDDVKERLPEYRGWNAGQVHEESSFLSDKLIQYAKQNRLNVVHDMTMKTPEKAEALARAFKAAGYKVELGYMYAPPHVAATRAVGRALTTGRYVAPKVILGNTRNEEAFDRVRPLADKWSFWDNQGREPVLVAKG